jgi:4-amino-4-deoxy-L-arabinose transferase-like glycosyltransferase
VGYPAAIMVVLLMYGLGLWASRSNSQTFDEGAHLAGGYIHWTLGHPRIHTENGYLSQAIAALPLLAMHLNAPAETSSAFAHPQVFTLGRMFLYEEGNDFAEMLLLGRGAIGVLTMVTGMAVYGWSRKLFGARGGMYSLLLFALSPIVLAHGFLATSDMAVTCFFTLSLMAFWWLLERVTVVRFAVAGVMLTALFLSKMSAPLVVPTLVVLALLPAPALSWSGFGKRVLRNLALLVGLGLVVWVLIYATYDFTFSAMKDSPRESQQGFYPDGQWSWALDKPNVILQGIAFARDHRLLPESYLYGYAYVVQTGREVVSFANGMETPVGWWWFYLDVFVVTTPLPILALMVVGVAAALWRVKKETWTRLLRMAPLTIFIVTYAIAAIVSYRGSGPRHLLPMYPAICILLGSVACLAVPSGKWRLWLGKVFPTVMLLWLGLENALVYPHYLSYFNEAVGGPRNGYRYLVDSALDWGQDLPALAELLSKNVPANGPVYFSYFGSADPRAYGIEAKVLPSFLKRSEEWSVSGVPTLEPGVYCISATMLQNLYNGEFPGAYTPAYEKAYQAMLAYLPHREELLRNPSTSSVNRDLLWKLPDRLRTLRLARLCAYLRQREPVAQAGYSINIYQVTVADLDRALNGPSPYAERDSR